MDHHILPSPQQTTITRKQKTLTFSPREPHVKPKKSESSGTRLRMRAVSWKVTCKWQGCHQRLNGGCKQHGVINGSTMGQLLALIVAPIGQRCRRARVVPPLQPVTIAWMPPRAATVQVLNAAVRCHSAAFQCDHLHLGQCSSTHLHHIQSAAPTSTAFNATTSTSFNASAPTSTTLWSSSCRSVMAPREL